MSTNEKTEDIQENESKSESLACIEGTCDCLDPTHEEVHPTGGMNAHIDAVESLRQAAANRTDAEQMRYMRDGNSDMHVALCASRHKIYVPPLDDSYQYRSEYDEVTDAIFPEVVEEPLNFAAHEKHASEWIDEHSEFLLEECTPNSCNALYIYITGLTPVLLSFIQVYDTYPLAAEMYFMHYNRETGAYEEQRWA